MLQKTRRCGYVNVALEPASRRRDGARGVRQLNPLATRLRWAL